MLMFVWIFWIPWNKEFIYIHIFDVANIMVIITIYNEKVCWLCIQYWPINSSVRRVTPYISHDLPANVSTCPCNRTTVSPTPWCRVRSCLASMIKDGTRISYSHQPMNFGIYESLFVSIWLWWTGLWPVTTSDQVTRDIFLAN